jgi:hypothetical protein
MDFVGRLFGPKQPDDQPLRLPGSDARFPPAGEQRVYREVRTLPATDPLTNQRVFRSGVGVSTSSELEARQMAEEQARRALEDLLTRRRDAVGGYAYLVDKRVEPLVDVLPEQEARITVNGYGAIVMNARQALFADVDVLDDQGSNPRSEDPPAALARGLASRSGLGWRTYRTYGGWRCLCTNATFDPVSEEALSLLGDLGADPKYVVLCRVQRTFRARLTPKPWRAHQRPLAIAAGRDVSRGELQRYVDRTWRYATARFVKTVGPVEITPELNALVEYHDRWTQAATSKPLA